MTRPPSRGEKGVAMFTAAYVASFTNWFYSIGKYEFIVYVITMVGLVLLVGLTLAKAEYRPLSE